MSRQTPQSVRRQVTVGKVPKDKRYKVYEEIGRGGMGAVRVVTDRWLRRNVAMKFVTENRRDDKDSLHRFVEEAQITGQLDHPNIVPVYELGKTPKGELFFTMKRVHGVTFADVLIGMGRDILSLENLERIVEIVIRVCDALELAHTRGVVHRDIKLTNVMVGNYGQVFLLDWGLAHLKSGERLTSDEGRMVGTPGFMPPEQANRQIPDERSDIFGVGGLLYCALTERLPHPGSEAAECIAHTVHHDVMPPEQARPERELPPELCRIAMKALATRPDDRYQTVAALRSDLRKFQRGGGWLHTIELPAGEQVIAEGDCADVAYIVVSGECEAVSGDEGTVLRRMGPGEVFGETALLTNQPRSASVRTTRNTVLKVVTRAALDRELERTSSVQSIVRVLAERFREVDERLRTLERQQADP